MLIRTLFATTLGCLVMFLQQSPAPEAPADPPAAEPSKARTVRLSAVATEVATDPPVAEARAAAADASPSGADAVSVAASTSGVAVIQAQEAPAANGDELTGTTKFRALSLRHVDAGSASEVLKQLFGPDSGVVVLPDERTNALFISGLDSQIDEFRDVIKILDADTPALRANKHVNVSSDENSVRIEVLEDDGVIILKGGDGAVQSAGAVLEKLMVRQERIKKELQELQRRHAGALADNQKAESAEEDLEALKQTVAEDFELQQRLQLAEIEFLKARLAKLERRVKQKEQLKDRIIERRVEVLLSEPPAKSTTSTTQKSRILWSPDATVPSATARDLATLLRSVPDASAPTPAVPQLELLEIVKHATADANASLWETRDGLILMRPDEFLDKFSAIQGQLRVAWDPLTPTIHSKGLAQKLDLLKAQLALQMESLQIEKQARESKLIAKTRVLDDARMRFQAGVGPSAADVAAAEADVEAARSELASVMGLLKLYEQVQGVALEEMAPAEPEDAASYDESAPAEDDDSTK